MPGGWMVTALALLAAAVGLAGCGGTSGDTTFPIDPRVTEVSKFTIPKSPSGMFYDSTTSLLHILCGTLTNGDHYLYTYTTGGEERCFITIPEAVGMTRVDGFYIAGNVAYIVDSQGPIYADTAGKLGGSVYQVEWNSHPCGCIAGGTCTQSVVTWEPTVIKNWAISATEASIGDGGGNDNDFRNSGIVVHGDYLFGVNGYHPTGEVRAYPKSVIKLDMTTAAEKAEGFVSVTQKWSFDGTTFGRDVDMEGLACGADECNSAIYIGDEFNYLYKLDLTSETPTKLDEWDCREIAGEMPRPDAGIEALAFDGTYWYIGIQGTSTIHQLTLDEGPEMLVAA